ncbi:MAG: hypothetical protein HPY46_00430 [Candidatus Aminicenantes bacterium]|nr:hypothetical protein [Candidatus Aminicenantes bacterium]
MIKKILCQLICLLILRILVQAESAEKITVGEVLKIGGIEKDLLYQWTDLCVDERNLIYVLDARDCSLKMFDSFGKLVKMAGRKGEGPGEFNFPIKIKSSGNRLFVSELYRPGLKVFTKDLSYVSSIPIAGPIADFYAKEGGIIVAAPRISKELAALVEYDFEGREKMRINYEEDGLADPVDQIKRFNMRMIDIAVDRRGDIIIVFEFIDRVIKLNEKGDLIFKKSFFGSREAVFKNSLPQNHVYLDVDTDQHNNIFILCGHYSSNPKRDVMVLSEKGDYLTTFTLPEQTHMIYIDHNNFLYARADEGMAIKKYRLTYGNN